MLARIGQVTRCSVAHRGTVRQTGLSLHADPEQAPNGCRVGPASLSMLAATTDGWRLGLFGMLRGIVVARASDPAAQFLKPVFRTGIR